MFLTTVAFLSAVIAAPGPQDGSRAAAERQLVGEWVNGGACIGDITIRADGTFERRHYSPGNHTLSGTWKLKRDALPPTLVLTCDKSDWEGDVGKAHELKVTRLDDEAMTWESGGRVAGRFTRKKTK